MGAQDRNGTFDRGVVRARWWHPAGSGRVTCDLCPRSCTLGPGQRAFCYVRQNLGGTLVLTSYGRASGFCVDPIEKKPLFHFYPGSAILSFGTAGCNLGCRHCQNWDISKAKESDRLTDWASPEAIADAAVEAGCKSVAFTYNEPIIFAEYAIDTALACRARGIRTVAVTAGYISPGAREDFFAVMDGANVDLKAFSDRFYQKMCLGRLAPVLETLRWLQTQPQVWVEVTTLLIPGENDSEREISELCGWMVEHMGVDTPLHFSAFHPAYKTRGLPRTPPSTLSRARQQALDAGIRHVYTGNVSDERGQSTCCPVCGQVVIERNWYQMGAYRLDGKGCCRACGTQMAGRFEGEPGEWGPRRMRMRLGW